MLSPTSVKPTGEVLLPRERSSESCSDIGGVLPAKSKREALLMDPWNQGEVLGSENRMI